MSRLSHIALAGAVAALFAACGSSAPTPVPATTSDASAVDTAVKETTQPLDTATVDTPKQDSTTPPKDTAPPSDKCAPDDSQCLQTYCFPQDVPGHCSKEVFACQTDAKCISLSQCVQKCASDKTFDPGLPADVTPPADPTSLTCDAKCILKAGDAATAKIQAASVCIQIKCIDCNMAVNKQQCVAECAQATCADVQAKCTKDKGCGEAFMCMVKCGTDQKCRGGCVSKATPQAQDLLNGHLACFAGAIGACSK
jgi:hypothetical protein